MGPLQPRAGALAALALAATALPAAAAQPATAKPSLSAAKVRALRTSADLWATIDICNPADQPNTLGVRGSMPGDGRAKDKMAMSFRVQYLDTAKMRWTNLSIDQRAPFVAVGGGRSARQDGTSFQIAPVAGQPAFTLRGVVRFQWKREGTVLLSLARSTTAGRQSLAGADPPGFSAATCLIG